MAVARALIGPLAIAAAVWCAAGELTVVSAASAGARLAVPAPWWIFAGAAAVALNVTAWRRRPALAAPALLSTWPWWPVPMPAAGLLWTGPLAWLPVLVAVALALAEPAVDAARRLATLGGRRAHGLVAALSLAATLATAWSIAPRVPGGDEPHYLIIAQSLLRDGDLRIQNNHERRDYAEYFSGMLRPDVIQRGRNGEVYSIHAPGTAVAVLPAFAAFGYRGAQATVVLAAVLAAVLVWQAVWLATRRTDAAWFAWAAVALTPTFLIQSATVFPDGLGMLATAAGLWLFVRLGHPGAGAPGFGAIVAVSAALAALPWLHTRFAVLAAGLGLLVVWRLWRGAAEGRAGRLAAFLALPVAAAVGWFAFFQVIYGTPNPAAPYGTDTSLTSLRFVPGGLLALLADQQYGLLPYSPVLALWAVGVWRPRGAPGCVRGAAAITVAYLATVAVYWMWWAGLPAPPARFASAALPLVALPVGVAWAALAPSTRRLAGLLLIVSLATSALVLGVDRGALAWNMRDAVARWLDWLGPVVDLPRAWPSFFWRLNPADLATELPFLAAVLAWLAVPLVSALVLLRVMRAATDAPAPGVRVPDAPGSGARLLWSWWLLAGLMAIASVGWSISGGAALDPARSQLAVLREAASGRRPWRVAAGDVSRGAGVGDVTVRSESPGRTDAPPPWLALAGVPPGEYAVDVLPGPEPPPTVTARLGRSGPPYRVWRLGPGPRQTFPLALPAGAASLTIAPGEPAARPRPPAQVGPVAQLTPLALWQTTGAGLATAAARFGDVEAYFLDDEVFVEPEGFWVRGGELARVLVDAGTAPTVSLVVQNGAAANAATVTADGRVVMDAPLAASERREVMLPTGRGPVLLELRSPAGFRPSDVGVSEDRRYLGLRIEFGRAR